MQLIAVLIAFSIERLYKLSPKWQVDYWLPRWLHWSGDNDALEKIRKLPLGRVWLALLPAALIALVVALLGHGLISFVISVLSLLAAITCTSNRQAYREFLRAAYRDGDDQASADSAAAEAPAFSADTAAARLSWVHYQHYAAVLIAYVLLGVLGALGYASLRALLVNPPVNAADGDDDHDDAQEEAAQEAHGNASAERLMHWVDWVPVRITTAGFLLVGNFSRALPAWINSFSTPHLPAAEVMAKIAAAADDAERTADDDDKDTTPAAIQPALSRVALLKRNLLLMIVVLALLTMGGWFY